MWCGTTVPVESQKGKKLSIVDLTVRSAPRNCDLGFTGVYFFILFWVLFCFFWDCMKSEPEVPPYSSFVHSLLPSLLWGNGQMKLNVVSWVWGDYVDLKKKKKKSRHVMAGPSAQVICTSDVVIKVELCTGSLTLSLNFWYMTSWLVCSWWSGALITLN